MSVSTTTTARFLKLRDQLMEIYQFTDEEIALNEDKLERLTSRIHALSLPELARLMDYMETIVIIDPSKMAKQYLAILTNRVRTYRNRLELERMRDDD